MNIPQLRFSGFDGEWDVKELSEIAEISSGGTPNRKKKEYWNGNIPWITTSEVNFNNIFEAKEYITEVGLRDSSAKLFPLNTILIAMYGQGQTRGKSAVLKIEAATNQACAAIKVDKNYESQLIYHLLSHKYNELRDLSNDGSQKNLSLGLLSSFKLKIPSLKEEQNKVARFMNILNQRIEKQKEKVENLEQLKKGMMQKIFSQELRFKKEDGAEFPEWEDTTFGEISISMQYGMNAAAKDFDGENKYIRITDIDEGSRRYIEDGKVSPLGKLSEEYLVKKGDILFTRTGASTGKSYLYRESDGKMYYAGFLIRLRINENVDPSFVYYQTLLKEYDQWVKVMSMRSGQPGINAQEYSSYEFKLPCLEEQTRITKFIDGIENKIEKEKEKLLVLEEQKRGFMQGMFA